MPDHLNLRTLPIAIPTEIEEAHRKLAQWAAENHIAMWQLGGTCSRSYATAIADYVPSLMKMQGWNGSNPTAVQKHNRAVNALRLLVPREPRKTLPVHFDEN